MTASHHQTIVDFVTAVEPSSTQQQLLVVHNGRGFCDKDNVKILEAYLVEQMQNSTVDISANLALLKLYQLYPGTANAENVANVLAKGVMILPSTFFTGASTMISESCRADTNVTGILGAGFMLQSCLFEDFWKEHLTFASRVPGFLESVRTFILKVVSQSHSVISTDVLKLKLNLSDNEVSDIIAVAEKWNVVGNLIQINPNEDNQMQFKKIQENIELDGVLKVIHTLSR
ncbi:hypothetical protein PsorP6_003561 [Peronosclerospora sorghi]|uniref:Uncharacterized protein n=1 Tax=Peronosclerospora sorghi TaxID=230839 RepID=A0ACC0VM74_9STRA|nr:hypothetical protein PsorP6_003561 [Peronosclerospora sorghi]